ncbi:uncharacterized protein LOC128548390 isoform X2 [Mercenaria mercenaria]|nr:uncharacterized protein LOC128548390 isoform X2 [Mercenaria mercenaria]
MLFCVCCTFYPFTYLWSCLQRNGIHMNFLCCLKRILPKPAKQPKEKRDAYLLDHDRLHCATHSPGDIKLRNILTTTFNLDDLGTNKPQSEKLIVVTCKAKTRGIDDMFSALENLQDEELNRLIFIYRVFEESQKLSTYMLENDSKYYRVKAIFNYSEVKKEFLLNGSFHDAVQDVLDKKEP